MAPSDIDSGWSAATRVKVVSPEMFLLAMGHGLLCPEASIVAGAKRRVCSGVPGSQAAAGHPTDCIGTWDSRIACMPQQADTDKTCSDTRPIQTQLWQIVPKVSLHKPWPGV